MFTPYVNFGIGHDDNINVGPSSNIINLGGQQLVSNSVPLSKNFFLFNAGVSHRYLSPTPVKLFNRSAAYIWQSNVNYYRNDNRDSADFDLDVLSVSTGPLAIVAERWRVGVDFTLDYILQGHNELATFYGVAPSVTWNIDKNTDITLNSKFQQRDFKEDVAPDRDSDYQVVGLNVGRAFFDTKLMLQVGANYFNENADISRFSNDGFELLAGASYRAWPGGSIYAKNVYKDIDFDGNEVLFNESRSEHENRATVGLNHRFTQAYIKDWTMDANVTYSSNNANLSPFEYNRTQYSLTFGKYFQ